MKNYRIFLFDWDGCLVKTLPIWLEAFKKVLAEYGLFPPDKEIGKKVFGSWEGPLRVGLPKKDLEAFFNKVLPMVNKAVLTVPFQPEAGELLRTLKGGGKKLALLTTSKRETIWPVFTRLGLEKIFDLVLTCDDVKKQKPNPEMIEKSLAFFKANKEEAVIVGDSKSDLGMAQNAKIDSVLFYPPEHDLFYHKENLLAFKPTWVVESFGELKKKIEGIIDQS